MVRVWKRKERMGEVVDDFPFWQLTSGWRWMRGFGDV